MTLGLALPAASLLAGLYAGRGNGGGSEFSEERGRVYGAQADIAEQMRDLYKSRIANEERYLGDAMGRVFGYVDETMGRRPDLLYAPGIFEFMPRDVPPPSVPEWVPLGGPEKVETVTPPPEDLPPFPETLEWQDMAKLKPGTDIVPPLDVGVLAQLMSGTMGNIWDTASGVISGLKDDFLRFIGSEPDWESWSDEEIWENLWEEKGKPGTNWKEWLGIEDLPLAAALRGLETLMHDTLGIDKKRGEAGEKFNYPYKQQYDPRGLEELMTRVMSTRDFTPPGESSGPFEDYIDPTTLEVVGPTVPGRAPMPDIDMDEFIAAMQARAESGISDFTGLPTTILPEPAWRRRSREEGVRRQVEEGEYEPVADEGFVPIRPVSAAEVKRLYDAGLNMEFVNADGSSLTSSEWEAFQRGEGDPVYAKGVHSGEAKKPGWWGDADYSGIYYLTMDEIDAFLSGEGDPWSLRGEGRTPQGPLAESALPSVSSLPPGWAELNRPTALDADSIHSAWQGANPQLPGESDHDYLNRATRAMAVLAAEAG